MTCERCKRKSHNVLFCEYCGERRYKAKLRIVDRAGEDHALYLFPRDYLIGRDPACDIVLHDQAVSRRHARLEYRDGRFCIIDANSKNGVYVQDEKRREWLLNNYDCIQIGPYLLHFYYPDADFPEEQIYSRTGEFIQQTLLKISREIQNKTMLDEVLNTIMDAMISAAHAREGILILPETRDDVGVKITRNLNKFGSSEQLHARAQRLIDEVQSKGNHLIIDETGKKHEIDDLEKLAGQQVRLLAMALRSRKIRRSGSQAAPITGTVLLRLADELGPITSKQVALLESLRNQALVAIENSFLYGEALAKRKIDNELEIARSIQKRLLPQSLISLPGTDLAAWSQPCHYVGGDYYDVISLGDHRAAVAIADISGKGIGAALMMSSLQGSLRAQISYESEPERIVSHLNQLIRESSLESLFATFFFAIYDCRTGELRYVNAGHNPPLVFRNDWSHELLKSSATALGVLEAIRGKEQRLLLQPGEVFLAYTDGLTEAMNESMQLLGMEPVIQTVRQMLECNYRISAQELIERIRQRVQDHVGTHPLHDDVTLLVLRRLPE